MADAAAKRSSGLEGARVALLEARKSGELATLIESHGGIPVSVPAVREVPVDASRAVSDLLTELGARDLGAARPVFIFSTGVGLTALFREADRIGKRPELVALLLASTTVCRGPKPVAALKKEGLEAGIRVAEPYTTEALATTLEGLELEDRPVVLVHYGESNAQLLDVLRAHRAELFELMLYAWEMPEDTRGLADLVEAIIRRELSAIVFTSQIQARHLFEIADRAGRLEALRHALTTHTTVAAVGPTCAAKLAELGAPAHVVPERPKMGPMVTELARSLAGRSAP